MYLFAPAGAAGYNRFSFHCMRFSPFIRRHVMRSIFVVILVVGCWTNALRGQDAPPEPRALQPLIVLQTDAPLVQLQKEKLNAAVSELNAMQQRIRAGKASIGEGDFCEAGRRFKDAVLDLNDAKLTIKTVSDYVDMMHHAYKQADVQYKAGRLLPDNMFRVRYYHLDAQILQLREKKKLEGK
ncbi:MAG: hypothetical protein HY289_02245 [Planctomycetes bacterium]|nr:hypothetical protein [Planctomycetota bacterium]